MIASADGLLQVNTNISVLSVEAYILCLHALAKCIQQTSNNLKENLFLKAITPVKLASMLPWFQRYPNWQTADLLIKGFDEGYLIPYYTGSGCTMVNDLKSVSDLPLVVIAKFDIEISQGRIFGPFDYPPFIHFLCHCWD